MYQISSDGIIGRMSVDAIIVVLDTWPSEAAIIELFDKRLLNRGVTIKLLFYTE